MGNDGPKLPVQQLTILAIARFAEPMGATSVNPYLPSMIESFGIEKNKIGAWAGLTSGVFSIFQSITAVPWGRASDRFGRKPVLLMGLLATMLCFVLWGLSTSLAMAITVRAIQGGSNGNVGIIRTMVAEMVTEKELQPRAFSIMPLVWSLGSVVGPAFGGFFAEPNKQFPEIFGDSAFFRKFPYALPNMLLTFFFLTSFTSALLFLHETLSTKKSERDWGILVGRRLTRAFRKRVWRDRVEHHRHSSFMDAEATAPLVPSKINIKKNSAKVQDTSPPGMKEVFTAQTTINLLAYFFLAFHSLAFDQNVSVLLHADVEEHSPENTKLPFYFNGGFGLKTGQIGVINTFYGIACAMVQFIFYAPMVNKFSVLKCFRICSVIIPVLYILMPYTSLITNTELKYTALAIVLACKAFVIIIAFPSTTILLTNSCTSLRVLGTLNGFATMFSGVGRAFGPVLTGLTFSWGSQHGYIGAAYWFLALVAVIGAIPVFMIVEGDGPSAAPEDVSPDTSDESEDTDDTVRSERTPLLHEQSTAVASDSDDDDDEELPLCRTKSRRHGYNTTD